MDKTTGQVASQELCDWLGSGSINIFGSPFSGKDTQGKQLANIFDAPVIGGGDILRNSIIPAHVKKIMNDGVLIPTADYLQIVMPYLQQDEFVGRPLVLSSVGRWHGEEFTVVQACEKSGHPLKAVIYLKLDERVIWRRWQANQAAGDNLRGPRHDDAAEVLEVRLEEFAAKTKPVIEFYRQKGLLIEVDGSKDVDEVTKEVLANLSRIAQL